MITCIKKKYVNYLFIYIFRNTLNQEQKEESSEDETKRKSPQRQSYVLKLFDRSVDLSQFSEDSPLYPICRAWMVNQPKANYKEFRYE